MSNITCFDPLERMHFTWKEPTLRKDYFQSKVHDLINSKFVKELNLGFSPNKASFRGGNNKHILLSGNGQVHVISSSDIKANPEIARIHTEVLLILSGQEMPGYTEKKQEPKKTEDSWSSLLPGFFTTKSVPKVKPLADAHNEHHAEEILRATTPRNKPIINPGDAIPMPKPIVPAATPNEELTDLHQPRALKRPLFKPITPPAPPPSPDSSTGFEPSVSPEPFSPILESEASRLTPPPLPTSSPDLIIEALKAENSDLRGKVTNLNQQLLDSAQFQNELKGKISKLEGENASLALKLRESGNDLAKVIGKGLNLARLEGRLRSQLEKKKNELENLQQQLEEARALNDTNNQKSEQTIQGLKDRIEQLDTALQEKGAELSDLQALLATLNTAAGISSVASSNGNDSNGLIESISKLRSQIEDLESKLKDQQALESQLSSKETAISTLQAENQELQQKLKRLNQDHQSELANLKKQLEDALALNNTSGQLSRATIQGLKDQIAQLESKFNQDKAELEAQIRENEDLESKLKDQQALESQLSSKETAISTLQAENQELQQKLERLNQDHQSELENLHERLATIQALSSTNDRAVQELSDQIAQLEFKFNQDKAELEAQIRENNGQRAALERGIAHLNQKLTGKGNRITVLEADIDRLQRNIAKLQDELQNQRALNEQLEAEKSSIAQRKLKKNDHVNELGRQIRELNAQLQQAKQELSAQIEENKRLKMALRELKKLKPAANTDTVELNRVKQDLEIAVDKIDELQKKINEKENEHNAALSLTLQQAKTEKEKLEAEKRELENDLALAERRALARGLEVELSQAEDRHKKNINDLKDHYNTKLDQNDKTIEDLNKQLEIAKLQIQQLELEIKETNEEKDRLGTELERNQKNTSHELAKEQQQIQLLQQQLEDLAQEKGELLESSETLNSRLIEASEKSLEQADNIDKQSQQIEQLIVENTTLNEELEQINNSNLVARLKELQDENKKLEEILKLTVPKEVFEQIMDLNFDGVLEQASAALSSHSDNVVPDESN